MTCEPSDTGCGIRHTVWGEGHHEQGRPIDRDRMSNSGAWRYVLSKEELSAYDRSPEEYKP